LRWFNSRNGTADPFVDLEAPAKVRKESDWLTHDEFAAILACAEKPRRRRPGLVERDRLVLLTLVLTGLRRSELIALRWRDIELYCPSPSLLVRGGKGGKPRRQPIPAQLTEALKTQHERCAPKDEDFAFCGLQGGKLSATALARLIKRCTEPTNISKHVTAHTLRHTAATWLRQATGDTRLVAEYLGHADLSTVSVYAHVAKDEMHGAAQSLADSLLGPPASIT
jgi:integrase/recombinase XerD